MHRFILLFYCLLFSLMGESQVVLQDEEAYLDDPMVEMHKLTVGIGIGAEFGLTYGVRLTYSMPFGFEFLVGGGRVSTGAGLFNDGLQTWTTGVKYKLPFFRYHPNTAPYLALLYGHNGYYSEVDFLNKNVSVGLGIDLAIFHRRLFSTIGMHYIFHERDDGVKRRFFPSLGLSYVLFEKE